MNLIFKSRDFRTASRKHHTILTGDSEVFLINVSFQKEKTQNNGSTPRIPISSY